MRSLAPAHLLLALCTAMPCCGGVKAPTKTARALEPPSSSALPGTSRARLVRALRSIPRPEPVLAALSVDAQQRLLSRYAALDAERKLSVHSDDSPLVESLPLLHLVSGGTSPRALFALATTSAGSDELTGSIGLEPAVVRSGASPDAARVAVVGELARRAALNFLRDRAADAATPGKATALICRLVARAAVAVDRREIVLLARELLASSEPSLDNRLDYARELARSGDSAAAARVVAELSLDARHPPRAGSMAALERVIESARVATAPALASEGAGTRLVRARAWLRLGRAAEARAALTAADLRAAPQRLDLAAVGAETMVDNPACPGLPLDVGSPSLCALAFRSSDAVKSARGLLDAAWQSGMGRDDEAVEVYVALRHVLPWLQEAASDLSRGALSAEDSAARVSALRAEILSMAAGSPWLEGLALFLETVRGGAVHSASGRRSETEARALVARASTLAAAGSDRFTQAGVLAVAATLSHQMDVSSLLDAVSAEQLVPPLRVPHAAIQTWAAVTSGQSWRMDAARTELAETMTGSQGSSLDRARLVLGVAEADAIFDPSPRAYQLLSRVAGQLLSDNIPPDLALRAVLDASGALAHGERFDQARKILLGAADANLPPDLRRAEDMLTLIRGYQLVLGVQGARPDALPKARAELAALAAAAKGEAAIVWFELWARELEALQADSTCAQKKLAVCRPALGLRRDARLGLDIKLGSSASAVLLRGALPSGAFDAGFRFSLESGLEPLLSFDPAFLAIGLPRFSTE